MEYVEGTDLEKILRENKLDPEQSLLLVSQICNALQAAHKMGIVHRDIKPENILISSEGKVKLADFGLSRPTTNEVYELTMTNMAMGTPDYMSPEQKDGKVDERSDIYALGIVFYEMLTGRPPRGAFDPPSHKVQVDVRLDGIVLKALQEVPERRYQHVTELSDDVDHVRNTPLPSALDPASREAALMPVKSAAFLPVLIGSSLVLAALIGGLLVWAPWRSGKKSDLAVVPPPKVTASPAVISPVAAKNSYTANTSTSDFTTAFNNGGVTITKYVGSGGDLQIPNAINGFPVIEIGTFAFQRCKTLTGISIPEGVTKIRNYAFENCSQMSKVMIPASVVTIEKVAFSHCTNLVSFDVSTNNTNYWTGADGILFSKDQTKIVAYPTGRTNSSYEIPSSVTSIEYGVFSSCIHLSSITIPDSVTKISNEAFRGCSGLSKVNIPIHVNTIEGAVFTGCTNLSLITVDPNNSFFMSTSDGVLFDKNQNRLLCYPAGKKEPSYAITNTVTLIDSSAFSTCSSLTNMTIPDSVTTIGNDAFEHCIGLRSITIPDHVTEIESGTFRGCRTLAEVHIGKGVSMIKYLAFAVCKTLERVVFQGNAPQMEKDVFKDCSGNLTLYYQSGATGFASPIWTDSSGGRWPCQMLPSQDVLKK